VRISIIIPALDEALALPRTLQVAISLRSSSPIEIIVADGGSQDGTLTLAQRLGARVVTGTNGRARQLNLGASVATGDVLVFLHADTLLPATGLQQLEAAVSKGALWGRFDVRIQGRARMLPIVAFMMNLRSRLTGIATGDQAMFMTRAAFDAVRGYPEQALMEDVEMSRRLKRLRSPACLRGPAITSGRRWETGGVWRTIGLMWRLRWAYWRGTSPDLLAQRYR
jgi:rSAM/selenodomain-associated transferase 2